VGISKRGIFAQIDTVASSSPFKGVVIPITLIVIPRIIIARKQNWVDLEIGKKNRGVTKCRKNISILIYF
jgi:hypothetical protein